MLLRVSVVVNVFICFIAFFALVVLLYEFPPEFMVRLRRSIDYEWEGFFVNFISFIIFLAIFLIAALLFRFFPKEKRDWQYYWIGIVMIMGFPFLLLLSSIGQFLGYNFYWR